MLSAFFNCPDMVYQIELFAYQTINSEYCHSILRKLRYYVGRKRLYLRNNWILYHDNAQPYTSVSTSKFIKDELLVVLPHSLCSPDLAHCNFWLFPILKKALCGKRFTTKKEICRMVKDFFKTIPWEEFEKTICSK